MAAGVGAIVTSGAVSIIFTTYVIRDIDNELNARTQTTLNSVMMMIVLGASVGTSGVGNGVGGIVFGTTGRRYIATNYHDDM